MDDDLHPLPLPPIPLMVALRTFAALLALAGPACAAAWLLTAAGGEGLDILVVTAAIACAFAGPAAGCVLWALAYLVSRQHDAAVLQRLLISSPQRRHADGSQRPGREAEARASGNESLLAELAEINANLLLTEDERRAKWERRRARLSARLHAEAEGALAAREFDRAARALDQLAEEFGEDERCAELRRRVSHGRAAADDEEVASETRRISDLMAISSFKEAQEAAAQLAARFPTSDAARSLLERVRREANAFTTEQRNRLFTEIQRHADARRWRPAFQAAQRLLRQYPDSPEADEVSVQMPTLQENARIEEVREMRDRARDLLRRRRYAEALRVAEDIVSLFPDTQAATELRAQMERIRRLAKQTEAD